MSLNPNDAETLADIGHYYSFMGKSDRGTDLTRQAMALNPLHPGWYFFSFARYHYSQRDYAATVAAVENTGLPNLEWAKLLEAAALGQLGETERAARALAEFKNLMPGMLARDILQLFNTAPDDLEHLMEGLVKAGLEE